MEFGLRSDGQFQPSTCINTLITSPAPKARVSWAIGDRVKNWQVGDEVVIHSHQDEGDDAECNGGDPMLSSSSQRSWGYETPGESFCAVRMRSIVPAATSAGAFELGRAPCYAGTLGTAYRMLFGRRPRVTRFHSPKG